MSPHPSVTGVVLAGGRSRRFGTDKRLAVVDGRPLVEIAVRRLEAVAGTVRVAVGPGESAAFAAFAPPVEDARPDLGPLSGMVAGLRAAATPWVLFTPVDLPWLPAEALAALVDLARAAGGAAIDDGRGLHALLCCLARDCLPDAEADLAAGRLAPRHVVGRHAPARLGPDALARWGDPARLLRNVNTPLDL